MKSTTALILFLLFAVAVNAASGVDRKPEFRVVNGQIASRTQFPYLASLNIYVQNLTIFCGGSLISQDWVLTAAHCVNRTFSSIDVILGAWNRSNPTEIGQQTISVPKLNTIVYPNFVYDTLKNDIALVKLSKSVTFNEYIQSVDLPKISDNYPSYAGDQAIASGWGRIKDIPPTNTDVIHWINSTIITNSDCEKANPGWVRDTNLCTDTQNHKSTCFGDSGGPLVLEKNQKPLLIGITSFGDERFCEVGRPTGFTRVTSYLDWIEGHTGIKGH